LKLPSFRWDGSEMLDNESSFFYRNKWLIFKNNNYQSEVYKLWIHERGIIEQKFHKLDVDNN